MLKLSLGLRITNSRRENLRKELHRGAEVHRLLRGGLAEQWQAAHPRLRHRPRPGLARRRRPGRHPADRSRRDDPAQPVRPRRTTSRCVAGLVSPRPRAAARARAGRATAPSCGPGWPRSSPGSPSAPAGPRGAVATEWFLRYLDRSSVPCSGWTARRASPWRRTSRTPCVLLDADGWPTGGRYRDNQGYYFRESRRADLDARLPGIGERQRHLRLRRGHRRALRLLPRHQQRPRPDRRVRLPAARRRATAARRLPALPRDAAAARAAATAARPAARLARPALQGQPADPAARPRRTRRPGRHPVRLRHHPQPPASADARDAPCRPARTPPTAARPTPSAQLAARIRAAEEYTLACAVRSTTR